MAGFTENKEMGELAQRRAENKARALMGFTREELLFASKVRKRFAELVREHHPDAVELGGPVAETASNRNPFDLDKLRQAKDTLMARYGDVETDNG
jgi:hypothetical protein